MSPFTVRPERDGDAAGVRLVHLAAFPTPAEADLVDRLRAGGQAWVSLVAEAVGQVVGHVLFSPVTVEPASGGQGVGLAPVAVLPAWQRRGVGTRLVEEGLTACRRAGHAFAVVLGHPAYYPRFGFCHAADLGLANEYGADEAFMALELRPGGLPPAGLVRYGPAFAPFS